MSTHVKVDVGTPTGDIKDWSTAEVRFHDFTNLTTTIGEVCHHQNLLALVISGY